MPLRIDGAGCLDGAFREVVAERPDATAIEFAGQTWSYAELHRLSEQLAQRIRRCPGYPGHVVVIDADRSPALVISMLACVKAGSVFLVLGEQQPDAYVARLVQRIDNVFWIDGRAGDLDARARTVAGERLLSFVSVGDRGMASAGLEDQVHPDTAPSGHGSGDASHGMYLIATSGTTGHPKLVHTDIAPVLNFIDWYRETFALTHEDSFSLLSGLGYDPLIRDVFAALCVGARVSIPTGDVLGRRHGLREWVQAQKITVIHATPRLASLIFEAAEPACFDAVRIVSIGGSILNSAMAARIASQLSRGVVLNVYGASETPQVVASHVVRPNEEHSAAHAGQASVPLGTPISEVRLRVLDAQGAPCAANEVGEIQVVTRHLARGYYKDPELTRDRFLFDEHGRAAAYSTGDLGFLDDNGNLRYVGRIDRQIKFRGYRIQLEEVERALADLPGVSAAAVLHEGQGDAGKLVAYVQCAHGGEPRQSWLKQMLVSALPTYMIPDACHFLDAMPLNSSNKIDYTMLSCATRITDADAVLPEDRLPARAIVTRELQAIWASVLVVAPSDIAFDMNFFDIGGNSLLSVKLIEQINRAFSRNLRTADLFVHPNINGLSRYIACQADSQETVDRSINVNRRADRLALMSTERNTRARCKS